MTTQTPSRRRVKRARLMEALEVVAALLAALPAYAALTVVLIEVLT